MTPFGTTSKRTREFSAELLDDELGRVHAREFARLLQHAALLRLGLRGDLGRWRRAAARACALAEIDGFEPVGLLRHALTHAREDWAGAAILSEASELRRRGEGSPPC